MEYTFYYELSKSSKEAVTYNYTTSKFKTMLIYTIFYLLDMNQVNEDYRNLQKIFS